MSRGKSCFLRVQISAQEAWVSSGRVDESTALVSMFRLDTVAGGGYVVLLGLAQMETATDRGMVLVEPTPISGVFALRVQAWAWLRTMVEELRQELRDRFEQEGWRIEQDEWVEQGAREASHVMQC